MISKAKVAVKKILATSGYDIVKVARNDVLNSTRDKDFQEIYHFCKDCTMTTKERIYSLYEAVKYVVEAGIPGDFVECGVWKGGSSMAMAMTLRKLGVSDRRLYLFDTFSGMSVPTEKDTKVGEDELAMNKWQETTRGELTDWCYSSLDEVKNNMRLTGYPEEQVYFVKGMVEETIPQQAPGKIALLRLDTDFYESTYHELVHLYPLLSTNGVLILDDYGSWQGAQEAVDTYLKEKKLPLLLQRIDHSGRLAIKTTP